MRTAELHYIHSLLEPSEVIVTGNQKRYKESSRAAKNKWLDSLTDDQREQLRNEHEQQFKNEKYD